MRRAMTLFLIFLFWMAPMSVLAANDQADNAEGTMNTYVIFFGFTSLGIENIRESPARVRAAQETVRSLGGEVKAFYGILGSEFDTMFIVEAPDDETVSKIVLSIAQSGNVRTRTNRLFTQQEYDRLISELP